MIRKSDIEAIARAIDPVAFKIGVRDAHYEFARHIKSRRYVARRHAYLAIEVLQKRGKLLMKGPDCPHPAEKNRRPTSNYCVEGECYWYHAGEPICPHPIACDREKHCTHPQDSHAEWIDLNR